MILISKLCYRTYAALIKETLVKGDQEKAATLLFEWIMETPNVFNRHGHPYTIDKNTISKWVLGKANIPEGLKNAVATNPLVAKNATSHFEEVIAAFDPYKENDLYEALWKLINNSDIAPQTIKSWHLLFESSDNASFLANVFFYAVGQENKVNNKETRSLLSSNEYEDDINKLNALAKKLQRPESIIPPLMITEDEISYVNELMRAYSDAETKQYKKKDELPTHLKSDFERRRKEYYAAESINRSARDVLDYNGPNEFIVLKEDVCDGVRDTCLKIYANGYQRMISVMEQVVKLSAGRSLFERAAWIGPLERKGVCHILAGERQLQWVYDDEKSSI